jgi:hypothetical protein
MKILALFGPQQSGKSEAAKAVASLPGWQRFSFADPLYAMLTALLGTDARKLPKNEPCDALCGYRLRYALQTLGTEWGREMIGDTIWLNALDRRLDHAREVQGLEGVVIDDLRFANEYAFLRARNATIYRIERAGYQSPGGHGSEIDWMSFTPDQVVENSGSVEDWQERWKYHLSPEP